MPIVPALVSDFTGADQNPLSEGGNWAAMNSSFPTFCLKRVSNAVLRAAAGQCTSYWTPADFGPDLETYVTIGGTFPSGNGGIVARVQAAGGAGTWDGYLVEATTASVAIASITNSTGSTIATGVAPFAVGDKLGMRIAGSIIQAWRQASGSGTWDLVAVAVDTTYASAGKIGLQLNGASITFDDFYCATDANWFNLWGGVSRAPTSGFPPGDRAYL